MSAKNSGSAPAREAVAADLAPLNFPTNLGHQQLALMTESACAMFHGSEAMREIQKQAAHQALARHEAAAQKLRRVCKPIDLLAVQSDLLRLDLQEAAQYWQQLTAAMIKTHWEMIGSASQVLETEADGGLKSALKVWQAAVASSLNGSSHWPATQQSSQ